jgi:hypothetical protein
MPGLPRASALVSECKADLVLHYNSSHCVDRYYNFTQLAERTGARNPIEIIDFVSYFIPFYGSNFRQAIRNLFPAAIQTEHLACTANVDAFNHRMLCQLEMTEKISSLQKRYFCIFCIVYLTMSFAIGPEYIIMDFIPMIMTVLLIICSLCHEDTMRGVAAQIIHQNAYPTLKALSKKYCSMLVFHKNFGFLKDSCENVLDSLEFMGSQEANFNLNWAVSAASAAAKVDYFALREITVNCFICIVWFLFCFLYSSRHIYGHVVPTRLYMFNLFYWHPLFLKDVILKCLQLFGCGNGFLYGATTFYIFVMIVCLFYGKIPLIFRYSHLIGNLQLVLYISTSLQAHSMQIIGSSGVVDRCKSKD